LTREEREQYAALTEKHYMAGTYYGQSASSTLYILANQLSRTDNDLLWLAVLGITYQYTSARISREVYEDYYEIYESEVKRLNTNSDDSLSTRSPDDTSIRIIQELRFTLWRHWNLYDAVMHSG
jgi:cell division control protein 45